MYYILYFILGLFLGSFYLVIGLRGPKKESFLLGRSHCDSCNERLKWYELIPLISFLIQKGKCRHCHKNINILNFIIELSTGLLFMIGYGIYGNSSNLFMYLLIASLLIIIFVSDFKYMIILDSPVIVASILMLICIYLTSPMRTFLIHLISGLSLFLAMYIIMMIGNFIFKKESLGGGDIKLCFFIGLTLNFELGLVALILSTFLAFPYALGTLYLDKKNELPYGPFLISAMFIVFIFIDKFQAVLEVFNIF